MKKKAKKSAFSGTKNYGILMRFLTQDILQMLGRHELIRALQFSYNVAKVFCGKGDVQFCKLNRLTELFTTKCYEMFTNIIR